MSEEQKIAEICLVPASEPTISIEIDGRYSQELHFLGYRWSDSHGSGLMLYFATTKSRRVLELIYKIDTVEQAQDWITKQCKELRVLGYTIKNTLSVLDEAFIMNLLARKRIDIKEQNQSTERVDLIKNTDPRPSISILQEKINELEQETLSKWNGKIYGEKGSYNFYINNKRLSATDEEVFEYEITKKGN